MKDNYPSPLKCKSCNSRDMELYKKFKDVIKHNDNYYTVYISVCLNCGKVVDSESWVEIS